MWRLADPYYLLLLMIPVALLFWHFWSHRRGRSSLLFSSGSLLKPLPKTWRARLSPHLHWLRYPGLILLVIALARPQSGSTVREIETFGVDIMMVTDVSGTMEFDDMIANGRRVSRLDAAKAVMHRFVEGRDSDRIGLIAFATKSLTRCPLTIDYDMVKLALREVTIDMFPEDQRRTAIGNALATGVLRLRDSDAKSRVIILLTDGQNTAGNIEPEAAAQIAAESDIRVYTVGFGTPSRTDVDEEVLRNIAAETGGRFYRSTSLEQLAAVYDEIDELEKSEVKVRSFELWNELFQWFLWAGCGLLLLEVLLNQILCRRVP
jgi:Ca-activated chloride channel family protein